MKVSLQWLKDYLELETDAQSLASRMIEIGNEVEGIEDFGSQISGVITGKIIKLDRHPDADKLQICQVDMGDEVIQVVTGASNVFEGAVIPVATVGARLPGDITIKKGKLRGVESCGMLCSGHELAITDGHYEGASVDGILILSNDTPLGIDAKVVVGIDSPILEFKPLANRPDCMSVLGLAREAAAAYDTKVKMPHIVIEEMGESIDKAIQITVEDADLCPRYTARLVRGVKVAPSPAWMRHRLLGSGIRPINNVVDITNFVMLEMGQPLHAFDLRYLEGNKIIVRRGKAGETIQTLDEKVRTLEENMLVIADAKKPVALAGIMGGENSGILEDTQDILIESAMFIGANVRQTSRTLGVRSESSARFEKGVDMSGCAAACDRAAQLMVALCGGSIAKGIIDCNTKQKMPRSIQVDPVKVSALLGVELAADEMVSLLKRLNMYTVLADGQLQIGIPTYRDDIEGTADIAEEIMRLHGYDDIPCTPMQGPLLAGGYTVRQLAIQNVKERLCASGLFEALNYSFIGPADFALIGDEAGAQKALKLLNPLGEELSLMRLSLIPGLVKNLAHNLSQRNVQTSLFELSKVYLPSDDVLPGETWRLGIALCGAKDDFYSLKSLVNEIAQTLHLKNLDYKVADEPYLHPGRSAQVYLDESKVAIMGELHPDLAEKMSIKVRAYVAEIDFDALLDAMREQPVFDPIPRFPSISRDMALVLREEILVGPVMQTITKAGGKLLKSLRVFDLYRGKPLEEGEKSVAFALEFNEPTRTLQDDEVSKVLNKVLTLCQREHGARLR